MSKRHTNMPVLQDFRKTKEIELPSYPDSEVEIYDSILFGESADLKNTTTGLVAKLIKSWNFTDKDGVEMPVTSENVALLRSDDVAFIMEQVKDFLDQKS